MQRGDIYLVRLDPAEGREQKGKRPVLIVSPSQFNAVTQLPVVPPITTGGQFARRTGFAVVLAGVRTTGIVRCDQPRVLDINAPGGHQIETVPGVILDEALAKAGVIFHP